MKIDNKFNVELLKDLSSPAKFKREQQLKYAAQQFEAMFLSMMLHEMRKGMIRSKLFRRAPGEDMVMAMLDQEMAKVWASQGGVGLSDALFEQLRNL